MRKHTKILALVCAILAMTTFSSCAAPDDTSAHKYDLLFGASSTGGMAYQWVTGFCDIINDNSDIVQASAITTLGSSENINLLASNEIDAGVSTGVVASAAAMGNADWDGKPVTGLNILNYMYADYCYVCVTANSPINCIEDLKGRRVNVGEKGGGIYTGMTQVLSALGIDETNYFNAYYLSMSESVDALRDGSIDALFVYGSSTNSAVMELQASRAGLKIFGFTPEEVETICSNNPMLFPTVMEDSYPGIPPVETVGGAMCFICTENLPDEVAYELCRILDEYHDDFIAITKWSAESTLTNTATLSNDIIPLSDGTKNYLNDNGYIPAETEQ